MRRMNNPAASAIRKLLLSWLAAVAVEYLLLPGIGVSLVKLELLENMSLLRLLTVMASVLGLLYLLQHFRDTAALERWLITAAIGILVLQTLIASFSWVYFGICVLMLLGFLVYAIKGWDGRKERCGLKNEQGTGLWIVTAGIAVLFFGVVSLWGVARVWSFSAPTYDFGIFSQMFYSMRTTGLPVTTLEREMRLSHFYVHVSPIYYLLLPFYALAPMPATLQVLQAAVITSSVIPLWKIGKLHGASAPQRMLLCTALMLYPAFAGGTGYDLHENCFLTPILLWLFYAIDRQNGWLTGIFTLLTLAVKEDAAVYTGAVALWITVKGLLHRDRWEKVAGVGIMIVSVIWFLAATAFLENVGDGVMSYRYENFLYGGYTSLFTVIKAVILSPMKAVFECVDAEKLIYISLTMLPLMGLPLITGRYERYLLLIPYVLVNLMSDYEYQHNIYFQYNFGSIACLFYLMTVNLGDMREARHKTLLLSAVAMINLVSFSVTVMPEVVRYSTRCVVNAQRYEKLRDALDEIPENASVAASTYYTTRLSQRDTVYDIQYATGEQLLETEYVALSLTDACRAYEWGQEGKGREHLVALLESNGYAPVTEIPEVLIIYHRK